MKTTGILRYILPGIEIIGLWVVIWLWYLAALAINHMLCSQGVVLSQPAMWFVFASRYYLTVIAGVVVTALVVVKEVKRPDFFSHMTPIAFLLLLILSSLCFTAFAITVGGCMCDQWQQWDSCSHSASPLK